MGVVENPMNVSVLFFAGLKETVGTARLEIELRQPQSCEQLVSGLFARFENLASLLPHCSFALNGSIVEKGCWITAGDELAILPPVSGG